MRDISLISKSIYRGINTGGLVIMSKLQNGCVPYKEGTTTSVSNKRKDAK